jgi:hypothetical protein
MFCSWVQSSVVSDDPCVDTSPVLMGCHSNIPYWKIMGVWALLIAWHSEQNTTFRELDLFPFSCGIVCMNSLRGADLKQRNDLIQWSNLSTLDEKIMSRVRGLRDKNKRGFSGFSLGVYSNPCRDYTQQISHTLSRLMVHKGESSNIAVVHVDSVLVILGRSLLSFSPESWS